MNTNLKPLSYLVFGDLHFREQYRLRYLEVGDAMIKVAQQYKPDRILITGDVLHRFKNINMICQNDAIILFEKLAEIAPLTVLKGNHDSSSYNDFLVELHPFRGINNDRIKIVWKTDYEWVECLRGWVLCVPWVPTGMYAKALSISSNSPPPSLLDCCIAFNHQEIRGCKDNAFISTKGDLLTPDHPPTIAGHIHESQELGKVFYVGTPAQTTSIESENKGAWLITIPPLPDDRNKRYIDKKFIPLLCTVTKRIIVTFEELKCWHPENQLPDTYGRNISWYIILRDDPSTFNSLDIIPHFDRLRAAGVVISTEALIIPKEILSTNESSLITTHYSDKSYMEGLNERLISPSLKELLHSILNKS